MNIPKTHIITLEVELTDKQIPTIKDVLASSVTSWFGPDALVPRQGIQVGVFKGVQVQEKDKVEAVIQAARDLLDKSADSVDTDEYPALENAIRDLDGKPRRIYS